MHLLFGQEYLAVADVLMSPKLQLLELRDFPSDENVTDNRFLPRQFLLGVNVDGIPGDKTPWAFAALCAVMVVIGVLEVWLFRRLKWI